MPAVASVSWKLFSFGLTKASGRLNCSTVSHNQHQVSRSSHANVHMSSAKNPSKTKKNQRNYYRVLFVPPDAPMEIVQSSYRTIMQKLRAHPDLGGDTWNASVINEAYETLIHPDRRAAYDKVLFKNKDLQMLALQSNAQRYQDIKDATDNEIFAGKWQDCRPQRA
jgi:hypothetical protein